MVLDNTDLPVQGVTLRLEGIGVQAVTDEQGQFTMANVPVGSLVLLVDGTTTTREGSWPQLEFDVVTIAGRDNTLGRPIYLLPLDEESVIFVDETTGGTLFINHLPGFSLTVAPGSVTFPSDDSKSGVVSVTLVHADKVPMAPAFGQQPRFVVTIQPAGAHFDPPAPITVPNTDGLQPGEVTEMYSFDHDLGQFVSIGTGTVDETGAVIASDPGVGILKAGWHCSGNPAPTGSCCDCEDCQTCSNDQCVADPGATASQVAGDCLQRVCQGGGVVTEPNDADVPADMAEDCQMPMCLDGSLGFEPDNSDTAEDTQGDCQVPICDMGTPTTEPDDTDLAEDTPGDCMAPTCEMGVAGTELNDDDSPQDDMCKFCENGEIKDVDTSSFKDDASIGLSAKLPTT